MWRMLRCVGYCSDAWRPRAASRCAQAMVCRVLAWLADLSHATQQPVFVLDVGADQVEIHGPYQRP